MPLDILLICRDLSPLIVLSFGIINGSKPYVSGFTAWFWSFDTPSLLLAISLAGPSYNNVSTLVLHGDYRWNSILCMLVGIRWVVSIVCNCHGAVPAGKWSVWRSRRTRQIAAQLCPVTEVVVRSSPSPAVSDGRLSDHVSRWTSSLSFVGLYFV